MFRIFAFSIDSFVSNILSKISDCSHYILISPRYRIPCYFEITRVKDGIVNLSRRKQCVVYLWDTSFGYARRRCVEYFTRLECLAAPIHRLFSLTRSRIHRSVCSPAVVTKFWMCKEVCNFCSNVSISLLSKFIAFNLKRFGEEIRTINEQHVSIYRIDCFLFERSIKNIANEIRRVNIVRYKITEKDAA